MATKKMTLIDLAFYTVLKDVPFVDDDDVTKVLTDVQVDLRTMRAMCKFDNGDIQPIGLTDVIEVDPTSLNFTTSHSGQEPHLKPNKGRLKNKKRD